MNKEEAINRNLLRFVHAQDSGASMMVLELMLRPSKKLRLGTNEGIGYGMSFLR